jgi:hypothetical protein
MWASWRGTKYTIRGKVVASPNPNHELPNQTLANRHQLFYISNEYVNPFYKQNDQEKGLTGP